MYLRFLGKNGSLGLIHGAIYDVNITSSEGHINVYWGHQGRKYNRCIYASPQSFAANWERAPYIIR